MMNRTEFYIVRHGETAANSRNVVQGQNDVPLNETGLAQAARLAERLKAVHFDAVYASDLRRAMRTARIIAPGAAVVPLPELREWNLGDWVGLPFGEVERRYPDEVAALREDRADFQISGGESKRQVYDRVSRCLAELAEREQGRRVLVVTHCGVIRAMLRFALGGVHSFPCVPEVGNTSLSRLICFDGRWQLGTWNDLSHLTMPSAPAGGY